jgi:hypothetical protein
MQLAQPQPAALGARDAGARARAPAPPAAKGGRAGRGYGSGRAALGIEPGAPAPAAPSPAPAPSLGDYVRFGRLLGERPADAAAAAGDAGARPDAQGEAELAAWRAEQAASYAMFEALAEAPPGGGGGGGGGGAAGKLARNKERLAPMAVDADVARRFAARQLGDAPSPRSAAAKALERNKWGRAAEAPAGSGPGSVGADLGGFEVLVGPRRPTARGAAPPPALLAKPGRPADFSAEVSAVAGAGGWGLGGNWQDLGASCRTWPLFWRPLSPGRFPPSRHSVSPLSCSSILRASYISPSHCILDLPPSLPRLRAPPPPALTARARGRPTTPAAPAPARRARRASAAPRRRAR